MKRIASALVLGTAVVLTTAAIGAENPLANRQGVMKNVGAAMGALSKMAKGEMDFNADVAVMALRVMNAGSYGYGELFPAGSEGGETEASPKIWEDSAGFQAAVVKFQTDTAAAIATPPTSKEELGTALGAIGGNCSGCHESYRVQK